MMKPVIVGSDKITRRAWALGIVATVALALLPALFGGKIAQEVPLFYSLPWGEAQIANKVTLFLPAAMASLFLIINLGLARVIYQDLNRNIFLARTLWVGTTFAIFLGLVTTTRIILLFL